MERISMENIKANAQEFNSVKDVFINDYFERFIEIGPVFNEIFC